MFFRKRNQHEIGEIYYEIFMINYEIFITKHEINTTIQHLGWNLEPHPPIAPPHDAGEVIYGLRPWQICSTASVLYNGKGGVRSYMTLKAVADM